MIETESGLSRWTEDDYRSEASREISTFFVAKDSESRSLTGFIIVRLITTPRTLPDESTVPFEAEILNIGVLASFRHRGIGRALLDEVLSQLRSLGRGTIHLEVRARNRSAIRFYDRFGFEITGFRPAFYREPADDAVLMTLHV
ncbi:MAG TPA: GNAT family N-acetyltransferase [Aridibacter sp.]|nr:GNAT family N-acetyltransferase [Aridibacter sp.]